MQGQLHQFQVWEYGYEFLGGQFSQNPVRERGVAGHLAPLRNSLGFAGKLARTGRRRNPSQQFYLIPFYRLWLAPTVSRPTAPNPCAGRYASVQCNKEARFLWYGKHPRPAGPPGQKLSVLCACDLM